MVFAVLDVEFAPAFVEMIEMMKLCNGCKEVLPIFEFYKYNDGSLRPKCKACMKEYNKKWRENNRERWNEYRREWVKMRRQNNGEHIRKLDRLRGRTEKRKKWQTEYLKEYRKRPEISLKNILKSREYRKNNPEKAKANSLARSKQICPMASQCELCPNTEKLLKHHPDYDEPRLFVTSCPQCHAWIHRRFD